MTVDPELQTMTGTQAQPRGEVLIRTLAMPADTNTYVAVDGNGNKRPVRPD
jgi:acyl-CoA hydrolase